MKRRFCVLILLSVVFLEGCAAETVAEQENGEARMYTLSYNELAAYSASLSDEEDDESFLKYLVENVYKLIAGDIEGGDLSIELDYLDEGCVVSIDIEDDISEQETKDIAESMEDYLNKILDYKVEIVINSQD